MQLAVVAMIVTLIFSASYQSMSGVAFEQDLHSIEKGITAEAFAAQSTGITQTHTFSQQTYKTLTTSERITVAPAGRNIGSDTHVTIPTTIDLQESTMQGRGVRWLRTQSTIKLAEITIQQECPQADIKWKTIAAIGEDNLLDAAETSISTGGYEPVTYQRLSQRRGAEDAFIYMGYHEEEHILLVTGTNDQNARLLCLLANRLEEEQIDVITERIASTENQLLIYLPEQEITNVQTQLIYALRELNEP